MNENAHKNFTQLEVWKKGRDLKNEIKELVKSFPDEEKYRLTDQLIRSTRKINANIAEGHGRFTYKEQLHFCIIARGSLSETLNHLIAIILISINTTIIKIKLKKFNGCLMDILLT